VGGGRVGGGAIVPLIGFGGGVLSVVS